MRHVVGTVESLPPGTRTSVRVAGRSIAVFNADGTFYALRDVCPHQGAALSGGTVFPALGADEPGRYVVSPDRWFVRCPWHGWEYDLASGQSFCDARNRVRPFPAEVTSGRELLNAHEAGPYVAETLPISVDGSYVVIEVPDHRRTGASSVPDA